MARVKQWLLVLGVAVLVGASGVLGGYLNRGASPDQLDRARRTRIDLGWKHRLVLDEPTSKPLLLEKFAGDAVYDLRAARGGANIRIEHGFGDVTLILPAGAGVRVFGRHDGVGRWDTPGFRIEGDYLVNGSYGEADRSLDILLFRGVGNVSVMTLGAVAAR